MNTNPGMLEWGQGSQSLPRAGFGREQEGHQERLLQQLQWPRRRWRDWSTSPEAERAGTSQPGAEQACEGSY